MGVITGFTATNSTIFLGTESGVWTGDLNSNLKDPNNWLQPFPDLMIPVTAIQKSGSSILVSTKESLVTIDPVEMMTIPFEHSLTTFSFENMVNYHLGWWFAKGKNLFGQGSTGNNVEFSFDYPITALYANETDGLVVGSEGTFGIVTKIICRLTPNPEEVSRLSRIDRKYNFYF